MYKTGRDPAKIVEEEGLQQVTDFGEIEAAIDAVIAANPDKVEQTKVKPQLAGWFVGQVMKSTSGKAKTRDRSSTKSSRENSAYHPTTSIDNFRLHRELFGNHFLGRVARTLVHKSVALSCRAHFARS